MSRKRNRKVNKSFTHEYIDHIDYNWCCNKINGHGGSVHWNTINSLARIGYIGNKNELQVFWYNIILRLKYYYRVIRRIHLCVQKMK